MSTTEVPSSGTTASETAKHVDMKLEVVVIPVSDPDRAKDFYGRQLGWRLDADFSFDNGVRIVEFTPPGSQASVQFGSKVTSASPGSAENVYLIVSDIEAARAELVARGVQVSDVFHAGVPGSQFQPEGPGRVSGRDPDHGTYRSFATFSDPDGNRWLLQEITNRLPGRVETDLMDTAALAQLLHETAEHHGSFEAVAPPHDWWDWYAAYMNARERGSTPEEASEAAGRYMAAVKHIVVPRA